MQTISTSRIIIVGAGLAALYAALKLAPRPVLMISPETLGSGASSAWAQGGVAAAMDRADSPRSHARDTELAGAGSVDTRIADMVTKEARDHILTLTRLGTPFDRTDGGGYILSREAAHSFARVVRVKGDQAGAEIMAALVQEVQKTTSIQVCEGALATRLDTTGDQVTGVEIHSSSPEGSDPILLRGAAYLLAGGGSGGLYSITTNPPRIRGQVIGIAARAGAVIADAEYVQFHPTAMDVGENPAPLATEALRGEGAILVNSKGERFMQALHKDGELAPRDIVARAIFSQSQAGLRPMLDTRQALGDKIISQFPAVAEACRRNGLDPTKSPIPVAAAAHYHMGGIATDQNGRASLSNLWVCGEASSTGLHGANRLASNGLLEALVFARICADDIDKTTAIKTDTTPPAQVQLSFSGNASNAPDSSITSLRTLMTENVGVVRSPDGLKAALKNIAELETRYHFDPNFLNMTATATLIAVAALNRNESRGAHARSDFPEFQNSDGQRSYLLWQDALEMRVSLCEDTS